MPHFDDVVRLYMRKSQEVVREFEDSLGEELASFYARLDDVVLKNRFGIEQWIVEQEGMSGLVKRGLHHPLASTYFCFTEELYKFVCQDERVSDADVNSRLEGFLGCKPNIERGELKHEIAMNSDLSDERLVDYLLKLQGPFGTRAFVVCENRTIIDVFDVAKYRIMMVFLGKRVSELLCKNEKKKKESTESESFDFDGDIDF